MKKSFYVMMALLSVMLWSCYPDGPEEAEDLDLVITKYDPQFNFASTGTFALPEKVVKVSNQNTGDDDDDEVEFVREPYGSLILTSVRENLIAMGWREVSVNDSPDVLVLPTASTTTNINFYYQPNYYWNWWYGAYYYDPWSWYYPGYYYPLTTAYRTGSVFIQMVQPDGTSATDQVPVVWSAVFNGLLEGSISTLSERIERGIDQAFRQSLYLRKQANSN